METTSLANILDGKLVSNHILTGVKEKIDKHINESKERLGYKIAKPSMAVVLVGNNPASESYVKGKLKACDKAGINHTLIRFDESITAFDLLEEVKKLNKSSFQKDILDCTGVITASGFSTTSEALILGKKLWSIPLKDQYEQLSNSISLKEMGIYTKDFNIVNIASWLISYDKIDYKWENPIYNIVEKIIKTYGN
jgi:hypothetical protein